jgi:hypothetical protein
MENLQNNSLIIKNQKIINFYKENPGINIEDANLLFINLIENIFNKMSSQISGNINTQILSFLNENRDKIEKMNKNVEHMNENIEKMQVDFMQNAMVEFVKLKKDYVNETKTLLETQNLQSKDKMEVLLDKNTESLLTKTNVLLNEIIPKSKTDDKEVLQRMFENFFSKFNEEMRKTLEKSGEKGSLQTVLSSFESKYSNLLQNIQQPLYSTISSTEERLSQHLSVIREHTTESTTSQGKMFNELSEFLGKYKVSNNRGKIGEKQLFDILTSLYPSSDVKNTAGTKASGDFMLFRLEKLPILFENKEYEQNVNKDEIEKFHRDIDNQNMCGVFISQYSGISFKDHFQIDIHRGNVLVYIHRCNYNPDTIKTAVDIIDHLSIRIQDLNINENNSISTQVLDNINEEFKHFFDKKEHMVQFIKESQRKLIGLIDELKFPTLEQYLEPKYALIKSRGFMCDICNNYTANTKQSLAAHKRGCARKHAATNS